MPLLTDRYHIVGDISLGRRSVNECAPFLTVDLVGGKGGIFEEIAIYEQVGACRVVLPDQRGRGLGQCAETDLTFAQRRLCVLFGGDIAAGPDNANGAPSRALALELGLAPGAKPAICPVASGNPVIDLVTAIAVDVRCVPDGTEHRAGIVGMDYRRYPVRPMIEGVGGQAVHLLRPRVETTDIGDQVVVPRAHFSRGESQIANLLALTQRLLREPSLGIVVEGDHRASTLPSSV